MPSPIDFDAALGIHERALYLQARRAGVLASNLANADTPGYKARDLDFKAALAGARGTQVRLATTHPGHLRESGAELPGGATLYRTATHPSLDGNTVDVQVEQAAFAQNAVQYQATLRFLGGRFKGMLNALKEQ